MIKVEAYGCSHCKMISRYKGNVKRHEMNCKHDPSKKNCYTCKNYKGLYIDEDDWQTGYKAEEPTVECSLNNMPSAKDMHKECIEWESNQSKGE